MTTECTTQIPTVDQVEKSVEIKSTKVSRALQIENDLPALPSWLDPVNNLKTALR